MHALVSSGSSHGLQVLHLLELLQLPTNDSRASRACMASRKRPAVTAFGSPGKFAFAQGRPVFVFGFVRGRSSSLEVAAYVTPEVRETPSRWPGTRYMRARAVSPVTIGDDDSTELHSLKAIGRRSRVRPSGVRELEEPCAHNMQWMTGDGQGPRRTSFFTGGPRSCQERPATPGNEPGRNCCLTFRARKGSVSRPAPRPRRCLPS